MGSEARSESEFRAADPWQITGYLIAGVGFYGFLGWLADRYFGTTFWVAVGIVFGSSMALYLVWRRLKYLEHGESQHK